MDKPKQKVLVVEDETSLSQVIQRKLTKHGYDVIVTADGRKAIEIIKQHDGAISGIWLDFDVLSINGLEFMKQFITIDGWQKSPVLIVSNTGNPELIRQTIELGAKKWIVKAEARLDNTVDEFKKLIDKAHNGDSD